MVNMNESYLEMMLFMVIGPFFLFHWEKQVPGILS